MVSLPTHYRREDWVTYALYWLLRLEADRATERHQKPLHEPSVFAVTAKPGLHGNPTPLHTALSSNGCRDHGPYDVIKALAAALRYAFLSGIHIERVDCLVCSGQLCLELHMTDETSHFIAPAKLPDTSALALLILAGSPVSWLALDKWPDCTPLVPATTDQPTDKTQMSQRFHRDYFDALSSVGAPHVGDNLWSAPPGNSLQDLSAYVASIPLKEASHLTTG